MDDALYRAMRPSSFSPGGLRNHGYRLNAAWADHNTFVEIRGFDTATGTIYDNGNCGCVNVTNGNNGNAL
ncbi:MAG TPA: hypothetical protein VK395_22915, partial [Gemmataceae bacterium]|nr:hypothetical protein [Gemmataceae bacterium]